MPEYHIRPLVDAAAIAPLRTVLEDDSGSDHAPVSVRIVDPYLAWNDGVWRITPGAQGCAVERREADPEATVDVRGLALLLSGFPPAAVRRAGWAEGSARALAALAALSGGRRPYRSPLDTF